MKTWTWIAPSANSRADRAIINAFEGGQGKWEDQPLTCSRSQLKRLIEEGRVTVNSQTIKPGSKLPSGSKIIIHFPEPEPLALVPEERTLDILYEDEHLIVVNKPPGLTVHPSSTQTRGTLVHALLHHVKDLSGIGGKLRPGIVHRIDKDTSGALVVTKTDFAHRKLVELFSRHEIERKYWALIYGSPRLPSGKIESLLGRNPKDRKKMSMKVTRGRKAVSHYQVVETYSLKSHLRDEARPFSSWVEVRLETGRTHQIRVHFTGIGHSILGDPVYGTPSEKQSKWTSLPLEVQTAVESLPGQALHARTLGFLHPVSQKKLYFEADLPSEMVLLFELLRKYKRAWSTHGY